MSTRRIVTGFTAGLALVAGLMLPATAAQAAPGFCTSHKVVTITDKTVTVQNPCGNLQARYKVEWRSGGKTTTWTFLLAPLAKWSKTPGGAGGWSVSVY
jgi:hypothetical protein